jgi:hypothetical protein
MVATVLGDVAVVLVDVPEQDVGEPATPVDADVACDVDPDIVGNDPSPTVPRPAVPRSLAPRPATPTPDAFGL